MKMRNIIGTGLATAAFLAGLVTPAQADQSGENPGRKVVKLESAPMQPDAWAHCNTLLCLWDNENYTGFMTPNKQSGNLGPSYQDRADSLRNKTGYYIGLYRDAGWTGDWCLLVPPLASHPNLGQIAPVGLWHDSISSVKYALYEQDACSG